MIRRMPACTVEQRRVQLAEISTAAVGCAGEDYAADFGRGWECEPGLLRYEPEASGDD